MGCIGGFQWDRVCRRCSQSSNSDDHIIRCVSGLATHYSGILRVFGMSFLWKWIRGACCGIGDESLISLANCGLRCVGLCVQEWFPRWPGLAQLPGQMAWGLRLASMLQGVYRWIPMGPCMSAMMTIIEFGWSLRQVRVW